MVGTPAVHLCARRAVADERGFTLAELLVAMVISTLVIGGAVMLTSQVQTSYRRQIEDSTAIQEGRYALDWIGRLIRGAGNNPFAKVVTQCPAASTPIEAFTIVPNGATIRIQADNNPPDGVFGGTSGACNQANEDVTISFDTTNNVIVFVDNNLGGDATVRTDRVIDQLRFIYRRTDRTVIADATAAKDVAYVEVQIRVRTRTMDPSSGRAMTRSLSQEFRVRGR